MCENNRQTKCSTLQFTNQLTVWMRPPWTAVALRPPEGLWVLRCQRVWQLLNFYIEVFFLKISLTGQHTFARISDNALCFSDKRKAASVCRAGCSGERKHANTKTLVALVFSLSIATKELNLLRGRAHNAKH